MHTIALAQQKGGCGKSALAICLACKSVRQKFPTAIVDLDGDQGTTLKWAARRNGSADPCGPLVIRAEVRNLKEILASLAGKGIGYTFLDLPGRASPTLAAGIRLADYVVIPSRPLLVDIEASTETMQRARSLGRAYAFVMNISQPQISRRAADLLSGIAGLGHTTSPFIISQRIQVPDAIAEGQGVCEAYPGGKSSQEFYELFNWIRGELSK